MNLLEDTTPVTFFQSNTSDVIKQLRNTQRPVIVTEGGEAQAVLMDPKTYNEMAKALGLFKIVTNEPKTFHETSCDSKSICTLLKEIVN